MADGGIISDSGGRVGGTRGLRKKGKMKESCTSGVVAQEGWSNWYQRIETTATPVFRVKTDMELRTIVTQSRKKLGLDGKPKCRVRAMGSTQTEDGMVMQRAEENVVVVSLADHSPTHQDWADGIDVETGRARFRAGMVWYEAVTIYRPRGFILRERSAAPRFTVGGVVSNMVHGGTNSGGFVHSDVTKLLVMLSDGAVSEVEGEELRFWRSGAGQLGIILAAEFQLVSENNGGLSMSRSTVSYSHLLSTPPTPVQVEALVLAVSQDIYTRAATKDHNEVFYDVYSNTLNAYVADFSGPPFSGDEPLSLEYQDASNQYLNQFGKNDADFNGGSLGQLPDDLCLIFCEEGSGGPPTGDGTAPCEPLMSSLVPGEKLCNVPVEVGAAFCATTIASLNYEFDQRKSTVNDGYVLDTTTNFYSTIVFVPSRALPQLFGTWWGAAGQAIAWMLDPDPEVPFRYAPNNVFEFRFINPLETAVMNPIPTFAEWKEEFDSKYAAHAPGESAFDLIFPEMLGIPDGLFACEIISVKGVNDQDVDKFFAFVEDLSRNMPSNPRAPYGPNSGSTLGAIVPECDMEATPPITFCAPQSDGNFASPLDPTSPCCNPRVPVKTVHLGKGWGYGTDHETTPITNKLVPFTDEGAINDLFSSGIKASSIDDFNAKVEELDADVFAGGALLRWLRPKEAKSFETRKLVGQECLSELYAGDPDAECISGNCDKENAVCDKVKKTKKSKKKGKK